MAPTAYTPSSLIARSLGSPAVERRGEALEARPKQAVQGVKHPRGQGTLHRLPRPTAAAAAAVGLLGRGQSLIPEEEAAEALVEEGFFGFGHNWGLVGGGGESAGRGLRDVLLRVERLWCMYVGGCVGEAVDASAYIQQTLEKEAQHIQDIGQTVIITTYRHIYNHSFKKKHVPGASKGARR